MGCDYCSKSNYGQDKCSASRAYRESFCGVLFDGERERYEETSWMAKKYGKLPNNWKPLIRDGFKECMRVLKPNCTMTFKWSESEITVSEILSVIPFKPLYGHTTGRQSKTIWMCFMKTE